MTRSMTGFGKACEVFGGQEVTIEMYAVNHRYLDASIRTPNGWMALEHDLKQVLRDQVARGKVTVTVSRKFTAGQGGKVRFVEATARQYAEAARALADLLGRDEGLSVETLAQLEGVFVQEEPEEEIEEVRAFLLALLSDAIGQFDAMRLREGAQLAGDIGKRLGLIRASLAEVERVLPDLNSQYVDRLRDRIAALGADVSVAEERIALEVAALAEKADVTEEVVRLKSHLDHMESLIEDPEPSGRRMDFMLQEIQREVNTLGVKTRDSDVARHVLDMKAEIEKIREQVQNVE